MRLLDPAAVDGLNQHFVDATIAFTHFIPITYTPETSSLKEYFQRWRGVILKRNNPGADIMIPVKLSEVDQYSYILIQVKNYTSGRTTADKDYPASGSSKLTPGFVFRQSDLKGHEGQFITLYWQLWFQGQLREVPSLRRAKRQKLEQQFPFAHFGFNFLIPVLKGS